MIDYKPYIPTDADRQESITPWTETQGCESFAHVHACEIAIKALTGQEIDYSEQALYQSVPVDPARGSTNDENIAALKRVGLVKTSLCPEPVNFTLEQFLSPIDPKIMATGQDWLRQWEVDEFPISVSSIFYDRPVGQMVLLTLRLGANILHEAVLLNSQEYFDSYGLLVKPLSNYPVLYANLLTIKPKTMSNIEFVHKQGTQEYGFYLPALSEDALKDKALNFGFNVLNPDGTINYAAAKEITGL